MSIAALSSPNDYPLFCNNLHCSGVNTAETVIVNTPTATLELWSQGTTLLANSSISMTWGYNGFGVLFVDASSANFTIPINTTQLVIRMTNTTTGVGVTNLVLGIPYPRGLGNTIYRQGVSINLGTDAPQLCILQLAKVNSTTVTMLFQKADGSAFTDGGTTIANCSITPFVFTYAVDSSYNI